MSHSSDRDHTIKVAIAQAAPVPSDLAASLEIALAAIEEAARNGAQLICFGESFLSGYPAWLDYCPGAALWDSKPVKQVFAQLRANSVVVPGAESRTLAEAAARLEIGIVIGVNERVQNAPGHGTVCNGLLFFGPDGTLLNHHRRMVPTYSERLVWGSGDSAGLRSAEIHHANVGGLICWEHWMPLARQLSLSELFGVVPSFFAIQAREYLVTKITAISHRNQALSSQAECLALSMKDTLPSASFTRT